MLHHPIMVARRPGSWAVVGRLVLGSMGIGQLELLLLLWWLLLRLGSMVRLDHHHHRMALLLLLPFLDSLLGTVVVGRRMRMTLMMILPRLFFRILVGLLQAIHVVTKMMEMMVTAQVLCPQMMRITRMVGLLLPLEKVEGVRPLVMVELVCRPLVVGQERIPLPLVPEDHECHDDDEDDDDAMKTWSNNETS